MLNPETRTRPDVVLSFEVVLLRLVEAIVAVMVV